MIIKKFLLVYINLMQHVLYFLLAEDGQFLDFFSACKVESESEGKKNPEFTFSEIGMPVLERARLLAALLCK